MSDLYPQVTRLVLGPLQTNCYLVTCPATHSALVIDPADEADQILQTAQKKSARIEQILLTHAHPDHLGGLPTLRQATGAKVLLHRLDVEMLQQFGPSYGLRPQQLPQFLPDIQLEGGEELAIGRLSASVIPTPGHTPGSVSLQLADLLFTGDTLFAQGVGRVDLPGGNLDRLLESIQRLFTLPDEYTIYPGHGPSSTIGTEKRDNPYV
jgi:glyoxylase-like metal-dependent hydrolase (beta-lactamase superfamily II)